jgi:alpha-tubulin suppressor-like RCC1 family protein
MGRCGHSATSNPRGGDRRICQEPRYVSALKNVVIEFIAAGDAHNLALSKNGRVFAWGAGVDGQCGQGHIGNLFAPKGVREVYFENGDVENKNANVKVESEVAMEEEILSHDLGAARAEKQILRIRAAGCYSAALTSHGDVYTWGYGGGLAMGHPIPAKQCDVPMLPLIEGNQYSYSTSAKTYPEGCSEADNIRDCVSFDTELNVLMPRRVEVVKQLGMQVEDISVGPGHMVVVCSMSGSSDDSAQENATKTNETTLEASDNNQTSDTDEVSSADLGQSDAPDSTELPLNDSVNTEAGANTSMTSTAEAASNISHESVESAHSKDKKRGFLAKMKSSRSSKEVSEPNEALSPCAKEKKKSFRLFRK